MLTLYRNYLSYLCISGITVNRTLSDLYHQSSIPSHQNQNLITNYGDDELNCFLIDLIKSSEYWIDIETDIRNNALVSNYPRLADLIQYMHDIEASMEKHKLVLEETYYNYPPLADFQIEDSIVKDINIDMREQTCVITLENVLCYGGRRKNKSIPVNVNPATLSFINIHKIEMKGESSFIGPGSNHVDMHHVMKMPGGQIGFCLYIENGYECLILQITCTDIKADILENSSE
ncbi:hypothetical protein HNQ56_000635 [Anaerotaenia torta]|uniref:hypothetical protein n=1 Tax=Anaerotaenia torta TaxID=433293 RepID=UPI003D24C8B0